MNGNIRDFIFELISVIITALITGIATYLITAFNKCPIDKIEIAYNRIYHPIWKNIKLRENFGDYNAMIAETKGRLLKYEKYASRTTVAAFKLLEENLNSDRRQYYVELFEEDIYKYHCKFRRKLGYPEPYWPALFKYLSFQSKCQVIGLFSLGFTILPIYLGVILYQFPNVVLNLLKLAISFGFISFVSGVLMLISKYKYKKCDNKKN